MEIRFSDSQYILRPSPEYEYLQESNKGEGERRETETKSERAEHLFQFGLHRSREQFRLRGGEGGGQEELHQTCGHIPWQERGRVSPSVIDLDVIVIAERSGQRRPGRDSPPKGILDELHAGGVEGEGGRDEGERTGGGERRSSGLLSHGVELPCSPG